MKKAILMKCSTKGCNNYKLDCDTGWEKIKDDEAVILFLKKKVQDGTFKFLKTQCSECKKKGVLNG